MMNKPDIQMNKPLAEYIKAPHFVAKKNGLIGFATEVRSIISSSISDSEELTIFNNGVNYFDRLPEFCPEYNALIQKSKKFQEGR